MRILIADDSRTSRAALGDQLRAMGHEVTEAADGAQAIQMFGADEPDLIVLDVDMPVMNGYDGNALEAALRLKEKHGGSVTVLTIGGAEARDTLKRAIAMGADGAIHVNDPALADADSTTTATVLAAAIKKIGEYDLILAGRQASDTDAGQVPLGVAELLGLPSVAPVIAIEPSGSGLKVNRMIEDQLGAGELSDAVLGQDPTGNPPGGGNDADDVLAHDAVHRLRGGLARLRSGRMHSELSALLRGGRSRVRRRRGRSQRGRIGHRRCRRRRSRCRGRRGFRRRQGSRSGRRRPRGSRGDSRQRELAIPPVAACFVRRNRRRAGFAPRTTRDRHVGPIRPRRGERSRQSGAGQTLHERSTACA